MCGVLWSSCWLIHVSAAVWRGFGRSQTSHVERTETEVCVDENESVSGQQLGEESGSCFPASGQRCGLIGGRLIECDEKFFEGLVCEEPMRVNKVVFETSTFLNVVDTVSVMHEVD